MFSATRKTISLEKRYVSSAFNEPQSYFNFIDGSMTTYYQIVMGCYRDVIAVGNWVVTLHTTKINRMKINLLLALFVLTNLFACKNTNNMETPHKDSTTVAVPKQPFDSVAFASKKDVACGMLLTAGVTDTAHYNGKIYGFCSPECKTDFLKTPDAFLASKYRQ
jgi:YHS domain-containing protein